MANRLPYRAQVFLRIGNEEITVVPPQHLVSFTYVDNLMTGGDSFDITLFDRDVFVLENKLHKTTEIELQWGYVGNMGKPRKCTMLEYEVSPLDGMQGVLLRIQGMDLNTDRGSSEKKSRVWTKPIHEIAKQIADEHGWGAKVGARHRDPTVTIEECEDHYDTLHSSKKEPKTRNRFQQLDESDLHFLRRFCTPGSGLPQAVSKHTGQSDFRFGIDADNRLHFHPLRWVSSPESVHRRFVFPDSPEGPGVLSFTPVISAPLYMKLGAEVVIGRGRDGYSGAEIYVVRDPESLRVWMVDPKDPSVREEVTDRLENGLGNRLNNFRVRPEILREFSNAGNRSLSDRVRSLAAEKTNLRHIQLMGTTPESAALEVHAWWMKYMAKFFEAELSLVGDPHLTTTDFESDVVEVNFFVRGKPHYTSGVYNVFSVLHEIDQNGKYTCKLELQSSNIFRTVLQPVLRQELQLQVVP